MDTIMFVTWSDVEKQKMGYSRSVYGRIIEQKEIGNKVIVFQAIYDKHQQADLFIKEDVVDGVCYVSVFIKAMSFIDNLLSVFNLKLREEYVYGRNEIIDVFDHYNSKYNPSKIYIESLWALPVSGEISNEKSSRYSRCYAAILSK